VQRLSLASTGHLYKREGTTDRQQASSSTEERSLRVLKDQLVVNPMWLTGGSIAVSGVQGAVSPDYRVFESDSTLLVPRYLHHLLRSRPYRDQYDLFVRANTTFDRRIQQDDLDQLPLFLPDLDQQRRIADFLDDRVARIDQIITARNEQRRQLGELRTARLQALQDGSSNLTGQVGSVW
jgi:type I restriction enzyme S subunit